MTDEWKVSQCDQPWVIDDAYIPAAREWGKNREVLTTSGTYPWSFVTQIFHNGQPSRGGDCKIFEVMTSTLSKGTLCYVPLVVSTSRFFPHSRLTTGFMIRLTRRVPLVEQELPTLPGHLRSPPVLSDVCVTRSSVLYVCFVDRCLSLCTFSFCQGAIRIRISKKNR
jgi:hypothetical protein